ncbi:complex I subunit 1/NuoH family protein [Egicoccus halophilus]|uniref:NADH-quinone oxidoreductase subunit H n=1 Tax=Egicoccus halophilus TaxID=1670830 RepID=A0A8J3A7I7_9ACTN|nr:NADH-quinone oxidoreductase subunit H [Egicoccus halophilus]GGI05729.1 NADH-quinone oxidoreductase subunit H [Egicoccus halophilus]
MIETSQDLPLWAHLIRVLAVFLFFLAGTGLLTWGERRLLGRMQARLGPNRIGPLGVGQFLMDAVKMLFKEDVTPGMVNRPLFRLAPLIGVVAAITSMAVIPISGPLEIGGYIFPLQVADLGVGVLWVLAIGSIHVYGLFLAGWSSNSPYPLIGGVRSSAQMISYEIAQGLAVASVFIYVGSLRVSDIVNAQAGDGLWAGMPGWFVVPLFPAFVVFLVGMVAEAGRTPFDLAEAEGELVGGFVTEYSALRFGLFMIAEFMGAITQSAIMVTLFFGGPSGPTFGLEGTAAGLLGFVWFALKTLFFVFFFILLRGALPRYRYDKLMELGWKILIPIALVWTMVTAVFVLLAEQGGLATEARVGLAVGAVLILALLLFVRPKGDDDAPSDPASTDRSRDIDTPAHTVAPPADSTTTGRNG